ncbi:hypothetical protein LTR86_008358 [Recurvomyces mirabilis]|nr:hypothetical protein LTR86_008358 [Recurvomyces mirabilis]
MAVDNAPYAPSPAIQPTLLVQEPQHLHDDAAWVSGYSVSRPTSPNQITLDASRSGNAPVSPADSWCMKASAVRPAAEKRKSSQVHFAPKLQVKHRRKYGGFLWPCNPGMDFPGLDLNICTRGSSAARSSGSNQ